MPFARENNAEIHIQNSGFFVIEITTGFISQSMGLVADSLDMLTDAAKEAHMKASMIFTSNDVIINAGVILAGVLVLLTQSNTPI